MLTAGCRAGSGGEVSQFEAALPPWWCSLFLVVEVETQMRGSKVHRERVPQLRLLVRPRPRLPKQEAVAAHPRELRLALQGASSEAFLSCPLSLGRFDFFRWSISVLFDL